MMDVPLLTRSAVLFLNDVFSTPQRAFDFSGCIISIILLVFVKRRGALVRLEHVQCRSPACFR